MKPKRVLVTGSSGFLGSHLADALEENGIQPVLFDTVQSKYKSKKQIEFIRNHSEHSFRSTQLQPEEVHHYLLVL